MNGCVPFRLRHDHDAPQIEWVPTHGARFTEPFFEDTIARLAREHPASRRANRALTSLDVLRTVPPGVPPSALIFHVSRCGSTLLSRMLAALPRNIVAAEPPILDDILRTSQRDPRVTDDDRIAWLRGAMHALGAPLAGAERFFVKLDCWHIFSLPLLARAFPGVPRLFVFRHPLEVLVSLLRRPSITLVRDTVTPGQLGLTASERDALGPEEHAAAILGAFFREASAHRGSLVPVSYEQLPDFVWNALPGIMFTADEQVRLQAAARDDAKDPGRPFVPDTNEKRSQASAAALAASARWAEPHYQRWLAAIQCPTLSSRVKSASPFPGTGAPIPSGNTSASVR